MRDYSKIINKYGKSMADLIEEIYFQEVSIDYKEAEYDICLDGRGYYAEMTSFGCESAPLEQRKKYEIIADSPEELLEKFVFYDGAKLVDVYDEILW